jgi:hypothetical protein
MATVAGARRYFRKVSMIYMDGDADLNTPATTASGCVDGMVVSHLTGRGAAEMVRFWGEPPLVREPDLAIFGVARLDPPEEQALAGSPLRRFLAADVKRMGAAAAAHAAIDRIKGNGYQFVLHLDVDVIADFAATNYPNGGGLSLDQVREALLVFAQQKELAALEVTAYNPVKDPDGSGAKLIIDLLAEALGERLAALKGPETAVAAPAAAVAAAASQGSSASSANNAAPATAQEPEPEPELPAVALGESWSSESLEDSSDLAADSDSSDDDSSEGAGSEESSGSHS